MKISRKIFIELKESDSLINRSAPSHLSAVCRRSDRVFASWREISKNDLRSAANRFLLQRLAVLHRGGGKFSAVNAALRFVN